MNILMAADAVGGVLTYVQELAAALDLQMSTLLSLQRRWIKLQKIYRYLSPAILLAPICDKRICRMRVHWVHCRRQKLRAVCSVAVSMSAAQCMSLSGFRYWKPPCTAVRRY